jgi:nicotinate-nucleotide adenylyltransferase
VGKEQENRAGMNPRRVAVFGGSFDPPHYGHCHLIVSLKEAYHVDEVLIIPSQLNPLKPAIASPVQRLHMATLAFEHVPGCKILDAEMHLPPPSYTIDTLQWLMNHYEPFRAAAERLLFLGADIISSLPQWKEGEKAFSIARPVFAARGNDGAASLKGLSPTLVQAVHDGWTETGLFDVSSTTIRDRVQHGLYIGHLVKENVVRYIHSEKLYKSNSLTADK